MPIGGYLSFIAYACATTFLPGPNNVLLLAAAGQFGFKRCLKLLFGIWTGLVTVMLLAGTFCTLLGAFIPQIAPYFKYVGAAYILLLAWKTFRRKPPEISSGESISEEPLTFLHGFLLQFLNVKVIMLGLAAYPGYFLPYGSSVVLIILFAVTMTACCGGGNLIWALAGSLIYPFYSRKYRLINSIMALLLVYCAVKIVLT
ncbi:MAG: LysE family transporter [Lachnospiraceae bacterium]|nr:LysE family transporter [Lachnospiraceae bacterium]